MSRPARRAGLALAAAALLGSAGAAQVRVNLLELEQARITLKRDDLEVHLLRLAAPELEGRASPSAGLERAATYVERVLRAAGVAGGAQPEDPTRAGDYRHRFTRTLQAPLDERCYVRVRDAPGEDTRALRPRRSFVPLPLCRGRGSGPLTFLGFGIHAPRERYSDFEGPSVVGRVVMILEGEPRLERQPRRFDGDALSAAADVHRKLERLRRAGAAGALVVRRPPATATRDGAGRPLAPPVLDQRYGWARWDGEREEDPPDRAPDFPAVEIALQEATRLLGEDVGALAARIEADGAPLRRDRDAVEVSLGTAFAEAQVPLENVVGWIEGRDPQLREEVVVLGAHLDHLGVDPRGRVARGADDNASGSAALLELAQAFARCPPRRSVLLAFFAAGEHGLLGSRAFCEAPPVPLGRIVAMLNVDMLGRGREDEVCVLGLGQNPAFGELLERARAFAPSGVERVVSGRGRGLWERSDHLPFHERGIPVLFFFEHPDPRSNPDAQTVHDVPESVDLHKLHNSTRFVFHTAWLIANDDEPPPPPR